MQREDELQAAAVYGASLVVLGMVSGIGASVTELVERLDSHRPIQLHTPYTDLRESLQDAVALLPASPLSDDFRQRLATLVANMTPLLEAFAQSDMPAMLRATPDIAEELGLVQITARDLAIRLGLAQEESGG